MITEFMTSEADAAEQRYSLFLSALRGLYDQALNDPRLGNWIVLEDLRGKAFEIGLAYFTHEGEVIERVSSEIVTEAQTATFKSIGVSDAPGVADELVTHRDDLVRYLSSLVAGQAHRDINHAEHSLKRANLVVKTAARAQRIPVRTALEHYRLSRGSDIQFKTTDRAGRRYPAAIAVRSFWRGHLLHLYNETVMLTLSDHGIDRAAVETADPKALNAGMWVAFGPGTGLPLYAEVRDAVFHPNANAVLA